MGIDQVWEDLQSRQTPLIVISGGEPMMQQAALSPLVKHLIAQGKRVEIETNGTIKPIISPTRFNVSPKLAHSGVLENKRRKFDTLNLYVGKGIFKFVCQHESDFDEIEEFIEGAGLPSEDIWIMPEGIERDGLLEHEIEITEAAILRGWNVTSRLHVLTWGARRGV
jgi:organic radical activating enzyme